MFDSLRPHGLQSTRILCPWDFPGKNTGVGCHFLLQEIFLTQGLNTWGSCIVGATREPLVEEAVFSPLYVLASFIKDKVPIDVWAYLWAFNHIPLVCISVFMPVPYSLDDCSFVVVWMDSSGFIFLSQNSCTPVVDSCQCIAKPIQYCKVKK